MYDQFQASEAPFYAEALFYANQAIWLANVEF